MPPPRRSKKKRSNKPKPAGNNVPQQPPQEPQATSTNASAVHIAPAASVDGPSSSTGSLAIDRAAFASSSARPPSSSSVRQQFRDERQTLHKLSNTNINDADDDKDDKTGEQASDGPPPLTTTSSSKIDINQVRCIIFIRAGNAPNLLPFPDVASLGTRLGRIANYAKLFELITDCHEISHPLKEIYNLDLGQHKESLISFTDHQGTRHTMPLYRFTDPSMADITDKDNHSKICNEWKDMIETGKLSDSPKCFDSICECNGRLHGVEVIEVLKTESVVAKCAEHHKKLKTAQSGAAWVEKQVQKENEELEARVRQLELKNEKLKRDVRGLEEQLRVRVWNDDGQSGEEDVSEYED